MATVKEKVEAIDMFAGNFRDAVKEKEEDTERYIKAFFG